MTALKEKTKNKTVVQSHGYIDFHTMQIPIFSVKSMNFRSKIHENPHQQSLKFENSDHQLLKTSKIIKIEAETMENEYFKVIHVLAGF